MNVVASGREDRRLAAMGCLWEGATGHPAMYEALLFACIAVCPLILYIRLFLHRFARALPIVSPPLSFRFCLGG